MNRTTLSQGQPWMSPEERDSYQDFVQSTTRCLAIRGIPETPLCLLRIEDVAATWLLARRLESALIPEPGAPPPCPSPVQAGAIGKCRDRLRRAMKELELCFVRHSEPAGKGIAEHMHAFAQQHAVTASPQNMHDETNTPATEGIKPKPPSPARPAPCPNPADSPATRISDGKPSQNHHPAGYKQELAIPDAPPSPPTEQPPPLNRATRRRQAKENRRKIRGLPAGPEGY